MPSADQLEAVFDRLRPLMAAYATRLVVLEDAPGAYALGVQTRRGLERFAADRLVQRPVSRRAGSRPRA
jgi:hypothetical protein